MTEKANSSNKVILSKLNSVRNFYASIKNWFESGDPIPKTHYKSMRIMIALLLFGSFIGALFIMNLFDFGIHTKSDALLSLGFMTFITLCPGLYAFIITIGCWRRIPGFEWGLIPFFD